MANQSITALVSAFARAYHASEDGEHVFVDSLARAILGETDYARIAAEWSAGAAVFAPDFGGDSVSALRCVVNRILAGAPLARAAFSLGELRCATAEEATQYLIFGAGYDSFAYCRPKWADKLSIWEIDQPDTAADKQERLRSAGITPSAQTHYFPADLTADWAAQLSIQPEFDCQADSFCSLLGLSYYLTEPKFALLLTKIRELLPNCRIAFDFPLSADGTDSVSAHAVLIDCGGSGSYQNAARQVREWLRWNGIKQLDTVVLTAVDQGHARNLPELMETVEVGELRMPANCQERKTNADLLSFVHEHNAQEVSEPVTLANRSHRWSFFRSPRENWP